MNLRQQLFTNNPIYQRGLKMKPQGIVVHSTGANNPNLSRVISPDDGLIGKPSPLHWNQPAVTGGNKCVHAFIGKLKDGSIATYQVLPWDYVGAHAGGSANNSYIGFEIMEDDLNDPKYFWLVYQEALELCAYLAKMFSIPVEKIICHSEAFAKGIGSNHADVMHWFPRYGRNMDIFRSEVSKLMVDKKLDNVPDSYAREAIQWAKDEGILQGNTEGDLRLHSSITRQDALVFMKRLYDKMIN